ncbi:MAG: hydantoinase B/oxoprolinase family protein, partial [Phycisphaerae bacterium]
MANTSFQNVNGSCQTPVRRQLAAARTGARRLQDIVARYGLPLVQEHMEALLDYSERLTRAAI